MIIKSDQVSLSRFENFMPFRMSLHIYMHQYGREGRIFLSHSKPLLNASK